MLCLPGLLLCGLFTEKSKLELIDLPWLRTNFLEASSFTQAASPPMEKKLTGTLWKLQEPGGCGGSGSQAGFRLDKWEVFMFNPDSRFVQAGRMPMLPEGKCVRWWLGGGR